MLHSTFLGHPKLLIWFGKVHKWRHNIFIEIQKPQSMITQQRFGTPNNYKFGVEKFANGVAAASLRFQTLNHGYTAAS